LVTSEIRISDLSFWVVTQYEEGHVSDVPEIHSVFMTEGEVSLKEAVNL